jgi:cysteine desulfurase family protein (TIGR01976 family)
MQAAADRGTEVRFVDFAPHDGCQLDIESLESLVDSRTRLVACTLASNAVGTITPIDRIIDIAHAAGALTYVDAVHFTPHGLVDVVGTDTDFLVASAYKWFGPHTGCLYGKQDLLGSLQPYKLRPASDTTPDRWETGTQAFESLAGVTAAVDYIASLGNGATRRDRIVSAYDAIRAYEAQLSDRFLARIAETPGVTLFGQPTPTGRTPTFAIEVDGRTPGDVAAIFGETGCFVWSGDYYAYEVMRKLNRPDGLVRIGFVHYNTIDEVDRAVDLIQDLA